MTPRMENQIGQLVVPTTDEYMHEVETASNFNESMYFNLYDPAHRVGLFVRLGNRPREGHAELTVALYLPDHTVAFMYQRPSIIGNERFAAGGLEIEIVRPFKDLVVRYEGEVLRL